MSKLYKKTKTKSFSKTKISLVHPWTHQPVIHHCTLTPEPVFHNYRLAN